MGVGRSGTTLLRMMLDSHSELTIPPETHFIPQLIDLFEVSEHVSPERAVEIVTAERHWGDFAIDKDELLDRFRAVEPFVPGDAIRAFFELYAEGQHKPRWGDKTPIYMKRMLMIEQVLPEVRFIHLIRDGRDVALSRARRALRDPAPISKTAQRWQTRIQKARRQQRKLGFYMEVRYEDLVVDTEPTLREICDFLDLPFEPGMLDYHQRAGERLEEMARDLPSDGNRPVRPGEERMKAHSETKSPPNPDRISRWRTEMSEAEREQFEAVAGPMLVELGYEVGNGGGASLTTKPTIVRRRIRRAVGRQRSRLDRLVTRDTGTKHPPAPFVVGVTRSGTTLLRMMLDAHPELTIPPETHFIPDVIKASANEGVTAERLIDSIVSNRRWGDFNLDAEELAGRIHALKPLDPSSAIRAFFELYAEREGKPRWGDKTPIYVNRMLLIERALPEARFVHLIRDGRDAALSRAKRALKEPAPMTKVAQRWKGRIIRAREQGPRLNHYLELRYEDLVLDTETTLRRLCEFIELPFDEAMLHYHERAEGRLREMARDLPERPGKPLRPADHRLEAHALTTKPPDPKRLARWKTEMSIEDQEAFQEVAGDLLEELGYEAGPVDPATAGEAPVVGPAVLSSTASVGPAAKKPAGGAMLARLRPKRKAPPAPFVVGMNRSGTTLLRMMLDAHPELTIPPETHFIPDVIEACKLGRCTPDQIVDVMTSQREWGDFGIGGEELLAEYRRFEPLTAGIAIRRFFEIYAEREGKPRWGDKTPRYVTRMRSIERAIPEARFIHLIRDGRDVALSVTDRTVKDISAAGVAQRWQQKVSRARRHAPFLKHYLEVRYEDLVLDTEPTLHRICEFIDLPFDQAMLDYHERSPERLAEMARELPAQDGKTKLSVERRMETHARTTEPPDPERVTRWRTDMSDEDRADFEEVAGELLADLGYEVGENVPTGDGAGGSGLIAPGNYQPPRPPGRARRVILTAGDLRARFDTARRARGGTEPPAPFIVGATRSGTTLLRLMLDAHPDMAIPSETHFIPDMIKARRWERAGPERLAEVVLNHRRWGDFHLDSDTLVEKFKEEDLSNAGPAIRAFFKYYAEMQGKDRWGDKTPGYVREMVRIQSVLPEARFLHLIRDGRDVAVSLVGMNWGPDTVAGAARRWRKRVLRGRQQAPRLRNYMEVRFEDLILDTEPTLRRICEFIELPFDDAMLHYHQRADERLQEKARDLDRGPDRPPQPAERRLASHAMTREPPDAGRVGRWRTKLSTEDQDIFAEVAGDLLAELGYDVSGNGEVATPAAASKQNV
ncbi:MAG: sulfotransferase [Solirubrobacterales bacterium]